MKKELKEKAITILNEARTEMRDLSEDDAKNLKDLVNQLVDEMSEPSGETDDADEEETPSGETEEERAEEEPKNEEETPSGKTEDTSNEEPKEEEESVSGKTDEERECDADKNEADGDKPEEKRNAPKNKVNNVRINSNNKMEKNFSLLAAIRSVANNKPLDSVSKAVCEAGQKEFRNAGLSFGGQIQIPAEKRDIVAVSNEGEDIVATDVYDVLAPLSSKLVLTDAGAHLLTDLKGDVKIPRMSAENVFWADENAEAADGAGAFDGVKLSPKRLTAFIDVSKLFILQDGSGAENLIRSELVNAIAHKLQSTILGADKGSATQPAGLMNGVTATSVSDFKGIVDLEAGLEEKNFDLNNIKYIASPKARAYMRDLQKGTKNNTVLAYNAGELDGTPVLCTSDVKDTNFIVGDFSNLYIGQWSGIDLTVDNYTQATKGAVRLVINAYFDAVTVRDKAFAFGKFGA